jgi:hypothetical protein
MSKFHFVKLQSDEIVVSKRPMLIMTKDQLNMEDLQGAHRAVMTWLNHIEDEIDKEPVQDNNEE